MDKDQNTSPQSPDAGTNPSPAASAGQVMDIQAPKPSPTDSFSPSTEPTEASTAPVMPPGTESPSSTDVVPEPVESESDVASPEPVVSAEEVNPTQTDTSSDNTNSIATNDTLAAAAVAGAAIGAAATTASPSENPVTTPEQPHKKGAPVVAIMLAVFVAVALAGLVVFMYLKSKDESTQTADKSKTSNSQGIAPKPQATPGDVDATDKEIESDLTKIDDTKDFSSSDLSDTALGL